jgi:hypothetical protein
MNIKTILIFGGSVSGVVIIGFLLIWLMAFIANSYIPTFDALRAVLAMVVGGFFVGVLAHIFIEIGEHIDRKDGR